MITKDGRPVVELKPIPQPARPITAADLDWLAERRPGRGQSSVDAGKFASQIRDDDWR